VHVREHAAGPGQPGDQGDAAADALADRQALGGGDRLRSLLEELRAQQLAAKGTGEQILPSVRSGSDQTRQEAAWREESDGRGPRLANVRDELTNPLPGSREQYRLRSR